MINKANIILTHNCNLNCRHCYLDAKNSQEDFKNNYELARELIDQLKKDNISNVMFTGGECMTFPYLKELIMYAKKLNMKVSIFTNGMIFDKEIFDLVDYINISVDGDKNIHNFIRQNKNSYDNIINVLDYLKQIDKHTTIQYTINNLNIDKLDSLIDLTLNHLNIRTVRLVFVSNIGRAKQNNIYCNKDDIEKTYKKLDELYLKTKYHIQFVPNLVKKYDFENYYLSGDLGFPLWFDIPSNKYYVLSEKVSNSRKISEYTKSEVEEESNHFLEILKSNKEKIIKQEYIDVEYEIEKLVKGEK